MKKILLRLLITLLLISILSSILFCLFSFVFKNENIIDINILDTLFSVIGIVFSVGYSIIISFSLKGIRNEKYLNKFKNNINDISMTLSTYFVTSIIIYMVSKLEFLNMFKKLYLFIKIDSIFILVYFIIFFTYNFYLIQKTKMQIEEQLNREENL
ncbi:hypothetical protein [uncultured Brachyspira sp.]|uniref:hypothetical protein n=1 Tax=uncultured Brachyspira sp. TaxID=221953 RepID=UPI0025D8AA57|nr:hypothetical protein [uncultured Brachyspira sp.]